MPHRSRPAVPTPSDQPNPQPHPNTSTSTSTPAPLQPLPAIPTSPALQPFPSLGQTLPFPSAPASRAPPGTPSSEVDRLQSVLRDGLGPPEDANANANANAPTAPGGVLPSLSVGVPRGARVTNERALPEELVVLLTTAPPPPGRVRGSAGAEEVTAGEVREEREVRPSGPGRTASAYSTSGGEGETVLVPIKAGTGLLTRGLAALGLGRLDRKASALTLTSPSSAALKSPSTTSLALALTHSRQSRHQPSSAHPSSLTPHPAARRARLDSSARATEIPRTWPEYALRYGRGELDIQDPPFPPIDAPGVFPTTGGAVGSPFEEQNFVAPVGPNEGVRQRVLARLDLLGLGAAAAASMGAVSHGMGNRASRGMSDTGSVASTYATLDSFGGLRRESVASTAPSSAQASPRSHKVASPTTSQYPSFPEHPSLRNDPALARVVAKARRTFGTRIVCVSLLMEDAQVFLASEGMPHGVESLPRHASLDSHTVLNGDRGLVVADLDRDWRFKANLLAVVLGARFYAATPIYAPLGTNLGAGLAGMPLAIGAISIIDDRPNYDFGDRHLSTLRTLAREVGAEVESWVARRAARPSPALSNAASPKPPALHRREVTFEEPRAASPAVLAPSARLAASRRFSLEALPTPPLERRAGEASAALAGLDRGRTHALTAGVIRSIDYATPGGARAASPVLSQAGSARLGAGEGAPRRARSVSPNARSAVHAQSRPPVSSRSVKSAGSARSMRRRARVAGEGERVPDLPERGKGSLGGGGDEDVVPSTVRNKERERPVARTPQEKIFRSAVDSIGTSLALDLVYLVVLDLSGPPLDPPALHPLAVYSSSPSADTPSFEPALHLQALRSPMGGLLYRNPAAVGAGAGWGWQGAGYATGVLLPVGEGRGKGWVLAGYSGEAGREFGEEEVGWMKGVAGELAKLVESA